MKIYTKTGDKVTTALLGGSRVPKHHIRIEAYGTVDELNSFIGLIRDSEVGDEVREQLLRIQSTLFTLGAALATEPGKDKVKRPPLQEEDVVFLEQQMDKMEGQLPQLKNFILPGGNMAASYCHVSRCVCRRAERITTFLSEKEEVDERVIRYLNRLSDYLFMLARKVLHDAGAGEVIWKGN